MTSSPLKIAFHEIPWEEVAPHARQKSMSSGDTLFRLLEFSPGFIEPEWCEKGHRGFVVSGTL
jgi:hypothetical protein